MNKKTLTYAFLSLTLFPAGCKTAKSRQARPQGIGFQLEDGSLISKGAILSAPEGSEELFLPFVVKHASDWVKACQSEKGRAESTPSFSLASVHLGRLRPAPTSGETAFEACLAKAASETQTGSAASPSAPAETIFRLQLALAPSS